MSEKKQKLELTWSSFPLADDASFEDKSRIRKYV